MSATELLPNLYWINGGVSNLYLCVDDDGLTLIDSGKPGTLAIVMAAIEQCGYQPADLKRIIITHADWDHAGSVAAIQAATGAMVVAGEKTAVYLRSSTAPKHLPRLLEWVLSPFSKYDGVKTVTTIQNGESIPVLGGLQAIATPGHTDDHLSFYSPTTGVLFAGDALNTRNGRLNRTPSRITADEDAATQSAINLLALAPTIIACGHGTPLQGHDNSVLMTLFNELRQE
jgi:glyoxylase-like metal-dependent hydrolase (beta-lactamase superfamily II)